MIAAQQADDPLGRKGGVELGKHGNDETKITACTIPQDIGKFRLDIEVIVEIFRRREIDLDRLAILRLDRQHDGRIIFQPLQEGIVRDGVFDISIDERFGEVKTARETPVIEPVFEAQNTRDREIDTLPFLCRKLIFRAFTLIGKSMILVGREQRRLHIIGIFLIDGAVIKECILLTEDLVKVHDRLVRDRPVVRAVLPLKEKRRKFLLIQEPKLRERQIAHLVIFADNEHHFILALGERARHDVVL